MMKLFHNKLKVNCLVLLLSLLVISTHAQQQQQQHQQQQHQQQQQQQRSNNNDNSNYSNNYNNNTMELREEEFEIGYILGLQLQKPPLYSQESNYQQIEIYQSNHFGKVFILDECLQLAERDAPNYNEMLAHVPIMEYVGRRNYDTNTNEKKLNVLVLGGGDGYVVSEVLKHNKIVKHVDHCELDKEVIQVATQFFPWAKDLWDIPSTGTDTDTNTDTSVHRKANSSNANVQLHIEDGAKFIENKSKQMNSNNNDDENKNGNFTNENENENESYHIIIQDSSDPFIMEQDGTMTTLPSHVLYTKTHFQNLYNILQHTNGVLIFQAETYNIPSNLVEIRKWKYLLEDIGFVNVRYGSISTPTYSTGQIGFFVAHAGTPTVQGLSDDNEVTCVKLDNNVDGSSNVCSKGDSNSNPHNNSDDDEFLNYDTMKSYFELMMDGKTKYYYPQLHRSSFDLPLWVHKYIYSEDISN